MRRVLNVGQCGYDHGTIARFLGRGFGADVVGAGTPKEAIKVLRVEKFDLVLVNRVSDADGSSGLDLIRRLEGRPGARRDPGDARQQLPRRPGAGRALGALPGFGKAEISKEKAQERLRPVLAD